MARLEGSYKRTYKRDDGGKLIPKPVRRGAKLKIKRDIYGDDSLLGAPVMTPIRGEKPEGMLRHGASHEEELAAIDTFAAEVGVTQLPPGVSRGIYHKRNPAKVKDEVEHTGVRTKWFEMVGYNPHKMRRRTMASEGMFCPVCEWYFNKKPKGHCPCCNHNMKYAKPTQQARKLWRKKYLELPITERVYRGFVYKDLERFTSPTQHEIYAIDIELAFYKIFGTKQPVRGDHYWMLLMIGYELQYRFRYLAGEPDNVRLTRQELRKGNLPEWATKAKENEMSKKASGKGKGKASKGKASKSEVKSYTRSNADNPNQYIVAMYLENATGKKKHTDEEIQEVTIAKFGAKNTIGLRRLSNVSRIRNRINAGKLKGIDLKTDLERYYKVGSKKTTEKPVKEGTKKKTAKASPGKGKGKAKSSKGKSTKGKSSKGKAKK